MSDKLPRLFRLYPVGPPSPYRNWSGGIGRYIPHQGKQEIARRKRQRERGILQ